MTLLPLVTVVCLCHNQKKYVRFALESVLSQTYKRIELIIVDDGSTDGSKDEILQFISEKGSFLFINNPTPIGNCKAFNKGFWLSKGEYIIDLAADDMLLPKRVEEGINDFTNATESTGVHFTDAFVTDENGDITSNFYRKKRHRKATTTPPTGFIFKELLSGYFICPPTMMIKSKVLHELSGYDERLSYEDFDFWIRSSRDWKYIFNPSPLVKKREVSKSLGKSQKQWRNKHLSSTYQVCLKALDLCDDVEEFSALIWRSIYEIKQCLQTGNFSLIIGYLRLIKKCKAYRRLSSPESIDK